MKPKRKRKVGDKVRIKMGLTTLTGTILYRYPKEGLIRVAVRPMGCEPVAFDVNEAWL